MLDEMKEGGRSNLPGTVLKKRSSSGCLIIKNKKKRRPVADADTDSDSDSQPQTIAQKVDNFHNGSGAYSKDGEFGTEKRVSNGLDVFEFDEYDDGFDEGRIRKDGSYRWKLYTPNIDQNKAGNGVGSRPTNGAKSRTEMEEDDDDDDDDESDLPLSVLSKKYRSSSNKPIRLQGKNGVSKVMVNNSKVVQKNESSASVKKSDHDDSDDAEDGQSSMSNSKRKEKGGLKHPKSKLANSSKSELKSCSRGKVVKKEGAIKTPKQKSARVKGKESTVKSGSGTEKQLLREKIKNMLFAAGWTIDYRPRRKRDYMDAVYTSPSGTAYWSIIKAYDALQKEEEDNSKAGGNFTPLADEILGKLTRQTQKKIEREMENKRNSAKRAKENEEGDYTDSESEEEKLNSYVKHSRKSKKSRLDDDSSENSYKEIPKNDRAAKTVHGRKSRKIGRCTLLVRSSDKGPSSENDGFVAYSGKRTLLSWLIDSEVVQTSECVQYMNSRKTRIMQKGSIMKDGIRCGCCSKILPVLEFELHAGSKVLQPFSNIYLQSGKSLMQCQIDAWDKQGEMERKGFYSVDVDGDDPNDDTCGLCGDGGDLICCDGCPSTFHQSCLDIQTLPQGDWHCPNCACKYCEIDGGNCTAICDKNEASLSVCCFCQKKYHESCRPEKDFKPIESNHLNLLFCQQKCQELHSQLQKLFGVKHELDSGFSWSLIHRNDLSADVSSVELPHRVECNSMLAVAMSVMDECFLPIVERRSGINLIRNVLFNCGSNLERLNYSGFFTAILEKGDEVVSAASIRIHGTQLAEMPFIGTRHIYRRQGMCRRLLSAIELALSSLEVEKLIIPAIAEHMHTWTDVFGFQPLEESHKQQLKSLNMLVFPGTDMLQKPLVKPIPQGNETAATNSCSQESRVLLEDDPSINKSELVSASSCDPTLPAQVPDVASHATTVSSDIPCEPKLQHSTSVDPHFDFNVKEFTVHEITPAADLVPSVVPCEPNVEEIALQNDDGTDLLISKVHEPSDDKIPTDTPFRSDSEVQVGLEKESFSSVEEIAVQNDDGTDLLLSKVHEPSNDKIPTDTPLGSDSEVQVGLEKEPFSSVEEICVQNCCETTNNTTETEVVSLEDQALNAPSNGTVSGLESEKVA